MDVFFFVPDVWLNTQFTFQTFRLLEMRRNWVPSSKNIQNSIELQRQNLRQGHFE